MPSQLEGIDKGTATLTITVPIEGLEPELREAASRISARVKIEGFRPGKAPYDIVKQRIGEAAIYEEAAERIVAKSFAEAVRTHELVTIGPPEVSIEKLAPNNPIVYKAKVALLPNVKSAKVDSFKARKKAVEVTSQDVDKAIEDLRRLRAKETAVDRAAEKGDRLDLNFTLSLDSVAVEGGQAEHYPVRLGDGQLVPGFEDQLIGMKANEEKRFSLPFPKENPNKQLAGKTVEVLAKVNQVFNVELPELNDEFAKSLGGFPSLAELRTRLEENLKAEREDEAESSFELELLEEAIGKAEFDPIPELLLHVETNRMTRELENDIVRRGMKWSDYLQHLKKSEEELRKDFSPNAERRVKTALLLKHLADQEAIVLPESEINEAVQSELDLAASRGVLPEQSKTAEFRESVEHHLRNKKVIDLLKSRAKDA